MRHNLREREFLIWAILAAFIITAWFTVLFLVISTFDNNKEAFLNADLKRFDGEVQSTLKTYESFSNYIFDEISSDKEVINIMRDASHATSGEKDLLRADLSKLVEKKYRFMEKYEFKQLHFHLPNTESFLRLHAPEQYGDILKDLRESVKIANETKSYVKGFEEGRIINGYRFVYPLSYKCEHIGTVEVSLSSASVLKFLSELYPEEDFHFIIYSQVIEGSVFDTEIGKFSGSPISDLFFIDREVEEVIGKYNSIIPHADVEFFQGMQDEFLDKIMENESFPALFHYRGRDYKISFLSVRNVTGKPVAYLISLAETVEFSRLKRDMHRQIVLVSLLAISIMAFSLVLSIYHNKLKDISQRDYLTKIYNRQRFFEMAERELRRSKRYDFSMSILMLDIDHFKMVNDSYGHKKGDQVLKELTGLISKNIRAGDVFARWGGEEFVILLSQTNKEEALHVAEKLRRLVEEDKSSTLKDITVSIGVAMIDVDDANILDAIDYADEAMYGAKDGGRNKVCCYDELRKI
ncbi:MAG: diguanylate cyclase [Tissierellaceae bacterium]